ncbi:hypothetical protein PILCRDRAFT_87072 [Piloderma croceum F 1598]|uniref:Nuclear protein DGCR14 n=1 Tax=Piloderma croceum (strain F 1598) TaxID=765440 RepID=A0A0C3BGD2_PILCF|nr:hypothetical protein PILCRDRAFT_87072 [Piloderma croceum F 1598]
MSTPRPGATAAPERSLNRQVILDEDEYTEALSHIVARDFFPSLVHLDATNEYLDALHTQDPHLINASVRRLQEISSTPTPRRGWGSGPLQTPSQTPYGAGPSETPLRTPRGEPSAKRARYDTNMSLDNFQAKYTSEDNSSFTEILDDENRKRKERWAWAWDAQKRVEQQRNKMVEGRERRLIEAPAATGVREKFLIDAPTPAGLITDGKETETSVDGKETSGESVSERGKEVAIVNEMKDPEVDVMAPKKDTRTAGVDGWEFKARNSLMFPPDADVTPYETSGSAAANRARGEPKVIKHGNTRLPEQNESTDSRSVSAPPSPTRSRIDAAIAGTPYRPRSPTINNFSLVPTMPSPTPSELGPVAVKQLMTWGTLNATPRILSRSDDPAEPPLAAPNTPFHIPGPSSREAISHKLSASASKSLRAKAGLLQGGRTPGISTPAAGSRRNQSMGPPTWTPRRTEGNLTPAAKRLLDRSTMGTAAARRAEAMGRMAGWEGSSGGDKGKEKDLNHVRWTPTPSPVTRRV